jgi:hypothetical protein
VRARRARKGARVREKSPGGIGFTEDDWRALEAIKPVTKRAWRHPRSVSRGAASWVDFLRIYYMIFLYKQSELTA